MVEKLLPQDGSLQDDRVETDKGINSIWLNLCPGTKTKQNKTGMVGAYKNSGDRWALMALLGELSHTEVCHCDRLWFMGCQCCRPRLLPQKRRKKMSLGALKNGGLISTSSGFVLGAGVAKFNMQVWNLWNSASVVATQGCDWSNPLCGQREKKKVPALCCLSSLHENPREKGFFLIAPTLKNSAPQTSAVPFLGAEIDMENHNILGYPGYFPPLIPYHAQISTFHLYTHVHVAIYKYNYYFSSHWPLPRIWI